MSLGEDVDFQAIQTSVMHDHTISNTSPNTTIHID